VLCQAVLCQAVLCQAVKCHAFKYHRTGDPLVLSLAGDRKGGVGLSPGVRQELPEPGGEVYGGKDGGLLFVSKAMNLDLPLVSGTVRCSTWVSSCLTNKYYSS
jgi:hypothetical protein